MNNEINKNKIPDEALRLLPWYATGWLSPEERTYIKKVLVEYPEFQELLNAEHEMIQLVREDKSLLDESLLESTQHRLERVLKRINAEIVDGDVAKVASLGIISRLQVFLRSLFPEEASRLQYVAVAGVSTLSIALLFAFVAPLLTHDNVFYPATVEVPVKDNVKNTTVILVGLNTESNTPKLKMVLEEANGKIDAIPGKNGMYRITLPKKLGSEKTKSLIKQLSEYKDLFWFVGEAY